VFDLFESEKNSVQEGKMKTKQERKEKIIKIEIKLTELEIRHLKLKHNGCWIVENVVRQIQKKCKEIDEETEQG
jgi:retron-type reverse transcriptase